jgi:hypothetical protein
MITVRVNTATDSVAELEAKRARTIQSLQEMNVPGPLFLNEFSRINQAFDRFVADVQARERRAEKAAAERAAMARRTVSPVAVEFVGGRWEVDPETLNPARREAVRAAGFKWDRADQVFWTDSAEIAETAKEIK